jgi:hypothetical protein
LRHTHTAVNWAKVLPNLFHPEFDRKRPFLKVSGGGVHWSFPDPAALGGTDEDKLRGTREIRDAIKTQIEEWIKTLV